MTPWERARAFAVAFPDRVEHGAGFQESCSASGTDTMYATWMTGQDYQNKSGMYGAFPRGYLESVLSLFPDADRILHLFSGSLTADQVTAAATVVRPKSSCGAFHHDYTETEWWQGCGREKDQRACRSCGRAEPRWRLGACGQVILPTQIRFDSALHPAAAAAKPDVIGNAENLVDALVAESKRRGNVGIWRPMFDAWPPFDVILADPPYAKSDQRRYWRESMDDRICEHCRRPGREHEIRKGKHLCVNDGHTGLSTSAGFEPFRPVNKKKVLGQCALVLKSGGWLLWLDTSIPQWSKKDWIWRGGVCILRSTNHRVRWATFLEKK